MHYCDTHVHSYRSFVGATNMTFLNITNRAKEVGIDTVAITDHLMKPEDICNLRTTAKELHDFKEEHEVSNILFGVEVCEIDSFGNTLLTKELIRELGVEVVIGGVHETHMGEGASLADIAARQASHHIMMMENPLIEILVHPWWLDKDEFDKKGFKWPEDMSFIPKNLTIELAQASSRTETYIEISTMSGLNNTKVSEKFRSDYYDYYKLLNENGALFAIGTDAHELSELNTFGRAKHLIATLGISENRLYMPKI